VGTGQWNWFGGSTTINAQGSIPYVVGGIGTPAGLQAPSFVYAGNGQVWIFGGQGMFYYVKNDLWKLDTTKNTWTWMSGNTNQFIVNPRGIYPKNLGGIGMPGGREYAAMWPVGKTGLLLFGGSGFANQTTPNNEDLNDFWLYNITMGNWTWVGGSNNASDPGLPQTGGTCNMVLSARNSMAAWTYPDGSMYLFGGVRDTASGSALYYFNEMYIVNVIPPSSQNITLSTTSSTSAVSTTKFSSTSSTSTTSSSLFVTTSGTPSELTTTSGAPLYSCLSGALVSILIVSFAFFVLF